MDQDLLANSGSPFDVSSRNYKMLLLVQDIFLSVLKRTDTTCPSNAV
jgi:hypothetical protein